VYQGIQFEKLSLDLSDGEPLPNDLRLAVQTEQRAAFQALVEDYEALVMRVALNVAGSQEAAQQIYCRVFKDAFIAMNQLQSARSVFVWVHRILVRHCMEYCRRYQHAVGGSCPEKDFESRLRDAIDSLPPTGRIIFQLKHYHGLRIPILAEIFDATPESISKSLQDSNSRLRRQLKARLRPPLQN
jgi:RNA polymerase sigma-70 factor, ECF subfamily